jgi:hypothetical protein
VVFGSFLPWFIALLAADLFLAGYDAAVLFCASAGEAIAITNIAALIKDRNLFMIR